jgi:hypothetical protein
MPAHANGVRLGHTLGDRSDPADDSAVRLAVAVANGHTKLEPRLPVDPTAVLGAESILGAHPRPVYAFVGSLHPDLGCVGLVLSRTWASRSVQGVTRCDSGGLFARRGAFGCLVADEPAAALVALSTPAMCAAVDWEPHFAEEIDSRHPGGVAGYVAGDVPNLDKESEDVRARCVHHAHEQAMKIDRRLWSWELRMQGAPEPEEILAIVLSQESFKRLENLADAGEINHVAEHVRILSGEAAVHWIDTPAVRAVLEGTER